MSNPPTLQRITGRDYPPATLRQSTLLIIDPQEEFRLETLRIPDLDRKIAEIAELIRLAREQAAPIVFIRHLGVPGSLFDPRNTRGQFLQELSPLPRDTVIEKRLPNAFAGTSLHDTLQSHGRLDLIVCGFMTHSSVSSTVRAAKDYGYRCTLVTSACGTRDIPGTDGDVIPAETLHRVEMAALEDNFAALVSCVEALP